MNGQAMNPHGTPDDNARDTDTAEVLRALIRISRRGVADARTAEVSLSMTEQSIVGYIVDNPGARSVDIARDFRLNRSTVSRQLSDLVRLGLVREVADGAGRGRPLELTPQGRVAYEQTIRMLQRIVRDQLGDWTDAEIARFAGDLRRFTDAASGDTPGGDSF